MPVHPGQLTRMNCSPMKCSRNHSRSAVSPKVEGSQSLTSFFMLSSESRAARKVKGMQKKTAIRISNPISTDTHWGTKGRLIGWERKVLPSSDAFECDMARYCLNKVKNPLEGWKSGLRPSARRFARRNLACFARGKEIQPTGTG